VWRARQALRRGLRRLALRPGRYAESEGRREDLAVRYLRGEGIEVGALHHPLWIPPGAHVRYVDHMSRDELLRAAEGVYGRSTEVVETDVVDDGACLAKFADESVDFVIANHVLEHIEDPIRALRNWARVVRSNGVLLITLPDARHTWFDAPRQRTTIEHVLRDNADGPAISHEEHFREWARVAEGLPAERIEGRMAELAESAWEIHYHAWDLEGFLDLLLVLKLPARIEIAQVVASEFSIVLRKNASPA
jgi:predicted SAM-dependent methyltransferase